jgi:hypothetical protein
MYIWNRADRVPEELNPERVTTCFNHWVKLEQQKLNKTVGKKARKNLRNKINRQTVAYENTINSIRNK